MRNGNLMCGTKIEKKNLCHQSLRLFHRSSALSIRIYAVLYTVKGECTEGVAIGVEMERDVHVSRRSIWLRCEDDWVTC